MNRVHLLLTAALTGLLTIALAACSGGPPAWTEAEKGLIASLSLSRLPALAPDPSNAVADNPAAAALGEQLFADTRFSGNGKVSCATCHLPDRQFQDDRPRGLGMGETPRRTMPIAGTAYAPFLFWDGRKDSQWSQALGPMESPVEHGGDRTQFAHLIGKHYRVPYEALFGPLPELAHLPPNAGPSGDAATIAAWEAMTGTDREAVNRVFANIGKSIAAFERTIMPEPTRFDRYADALVAGSASTELTAEELLGLRLFIGKASCINCHNGPLLTDNHFHNTGVPSAGSEPDVGRALGARQVLADPFNCLGEYSDAGPGDCAELRFIAADGHELEGAFKPPSLRGVADRAPFMNAGQIGTLSEALDHYNRAPEAPVGHSELDPLALTPEELAAIEAFLGTLS